MEGLKIRLLAQSGEEHVVDRVLSYRFASDYFTPVDSFFLQTADPIHTLQVVGLSATLEGKPLFFGQVDLQSTSFTAEGVSTILECRSHTAALLDNEVKPTLYQQYATTDLLREHAYPHGVVGHRFKQNATFREIAAAKGMSHWEFIRYFCKRAYGSTPFLDRDGYLTLAPQSNITHHFAEEGGIPYIEATLTEDRYKMLSDVFVKTGETTQGDSYNYRVSNQIAHHFGVVRRRYYHPAVVWENDIKLAAKSVIKEAQLDYRTLTVTLPFHRDVRVGEFATFTHPDHREGDFYITQVVHTGTAGGIRTTVQLSTRYPLTA